MNAKTELIQWYTPDEKLPRDGLNVITIDSFGFFFELNFTEGRFADRTDCAIRFHNNIKYWSYLPKGPDLK